MCIYVVPNLAHVSHSLYKMIKSIFRALDYSLYAFLQSDFTTFLFLLFRNQFVHTILMHCIPLEAPDCRVRYIFLLMMRSVILHHDFLACIRHFYAKQLNFRSNILGFYDVQGRLRLIELLYCSRDSLFACFSLPSLVIVIQIISILTCHCPSFACISTKRFSTPSALPSFSCNDQPLCQRVFTYGGGRQHEFSFSAVESYITAGHNYSNDSAFKFVDHIDSLGQHAYPIDQNFIHTDIPLCDIVPHLSVKVALKIARLHCLQIGSHVSKSEIYRIFEGHNCIHCNVHVTVFTIVDSKSTRRRIHKAEKRSENGVTSHTNLKSSRGEEKNDSGASLDPHQDHDHDTVLDSACSAPSTSRHGIHKAKKRSENVSEKKNRRCTLRQSG